MIPRAGVRVKRRHRRRAGSGEPRSILVTDRQPEEAAMASLYERRGGLDAIRAVVDSFVGRCAGDDRISVPKAEQDELLGLLAPMRDDIVEVESPETGTPLPATYQPAPALR
jgi:hypothetical protein